MIVDLEKLKKARTAVGITWTTLSADNAVAPDLLWLSDLLRDVIDNLEISGEAKLLKKGGKNEINNSKD